MTTETLLTEEQIQQAVQCITAEQSIVDGSVVLSNVNVCFRELEQAVLQSPEVKRLRRLAKTLDEKIEAYERYGAICEFEGDPMIHASHLEELRDAAMEKQP